MTAWLSIIGIGEDGRDGLSHRALHRLAQARLVVGGRRHLALAGPLETKTMTWPSPLSDALPAILACRGTPVCVLASGDPFFYGVGSLLAAAVPPEEIDCLPAASSLGLAAARLGWPLQDCHVVSLHGRDLRLIIPHLQPRARLLCLTWDGTTPRRLAELLCDRGFGESELTVLEALGGGRENVTRLRACDIGARQFDALNVVALAIVASAHARVLPLAPGLPDDWFDHDGQITKHEIRAMTLAALRPFRGGHLWDVGAGSGSISIEWALRDPTNRATAIEADAGRSERLSRNADAFGVPDIRIVTGRAPEALEGLAKPDAIFVGGGASNPRLLDACWAALPSGGRLVANAVTLETQAALTAEHAARGGDLTMIAVARAEPVGGFRGWRPAMPVMQWSVSIQ